MAQAVTHTINLQDSALNLLQTTNTFPDRVKTHGCWCSKLDSSADDFLLGGPQPLDDLDDLCKQYFGKRNCLTRLSEGSCENDDLTGSYQVDIVGDQLQCLGSGCTADLCKIDAELVATVRDYVAAEINSGGLENPTVVNAVGTCKMPSRAGQAKRCEGTSFFAPAAAKNGTTRDVFGIRFCIQLVKIDLQRQPTHLD